MSGGKDEDGEADGLEHGGLLLVKAVLNGGRRLRWIESINSDCFPVARLLSI